jgi:hypothetical protein
MDRGRFQRDTPQMMSQERNEALLLSPGSTSMGDPSPPAQKTATPE